MLNIAAVINQLPGTSIAYRAQGGIARDLLNVIPSELVAGSYTFFGREFAFRMEDPSMGRLSEAKEIDFSEQEKPFLARPYGLKGAVPFDVNQLTKTRVNRLQQQVRGLTDTLDRWLEKQTRDLVDSFTKDAVAKSWNDDTSDPIQDSKKLAQKLAMAPNVAVIGKRVVDRLVYHPAVKALRNTAAAGSVSLSDLAAMLEVEKILVPSLKVNTARKGQAENLDYLWGDVFWMGYRNPSTEIGTEEITFGAQVRVDVPELKEVARTSQVYAASEQGTLVRVWENPERGHAGAAMIQVGRQYDLKQIAPDLGRGLNGVLA